MCHTANLHKKVLYIQSQETFGNAIIYKNDANDKKAIAACDKVFDAQKSLISISFDLVFKTAVASGETPKVTKIKTYKPAN